MIKGDSFISEVGFRIHDDVLPLAGFVTAHSVES